MVRLLNYIKIKNQGHVIVYALLTTAISIALSLAITITSFYYVEPDALTYATTYIVAIVVPLIVAPLVSFAVLTLALKLERTRNQLETLSQIDALTNIYNRGYFWQRSEEELQKAKAQAYPVALILFDVDNFKMFNDTYGHLTGDRILRVCAASAASCVRRDDYVARYGGEEFAVFLKDCPPDKALDVAERIRQSIAAIRLPHEQMQLSMTVSVGVVATRKAFDLELLSSTADKAMYQAKHQGKNCVVSLAL